MKNTTTPIQAQVRKLADCLLQTGRKIATAESCTGGGISFALTDPAGASDWLESGFVTYSNAAKQQQLGVSADTLRRHGAVSEQTAREMALGALSHSAADYSLSVTGLAGPDGGSGKKPIGMVCFAWAQKDGGVVRAETQYFSGNRARIREQAILHALAGMSRFINR